MDDMRSLQSKHAGADVLNRLSVDKNNEVPPVHSFQGLNMQVMSHDIAETLSAPNKMEGWICRVVASCRIQKAGRETHKVGLFERNIEVMSNRHGMVHPITCRDRQNRETWTNMELQERRSNSRRAGGFN
jgi:hypothetical protein